MDALKKAEQEKKKAAEKLKESAAQDRPDSGDTPSTEVTAERQVPGTQQAVRRSDQKTAPGKSGLALEPIENKGDITDEFTIVDEDDRKQDKDSDLKISTDKLKSDHTDENEFEQTGQQPIPGAEPSMTEALKEDFDEDHIDGTFYGVELESDDTSTAMYEETLQGDPYVSAEAEQVYDETLPGVSAVELARDIGDENQPTPVAAQTIFAASASRRTSSGFKWTLIATVLIIIAVIAMGVIVYQNEAITPRELPSPLVARGIEDIVPAQTLAQVANEPVTGTLIQQNEPQQAVTGTAPVIPPTTAMPPAAGEGMPEEPLLASVEPAVKAPDPAAPVAPAPVSPVTETPVSQQLPAEIEVMPALFKISRSRGPDRRSEIINDAYAAYQRGDFAAAKEKYEKIVSDFPDSRDGLLGLGAIAMYEYDRERAFAIYSRLLTIDPKNSIAKTALINLAGEAGQINRESSIKLMLHDNPESSFLYFTLGNVYASQSRWAEAQQAFFDAYRFDSTNPDYALNLAITLDRLGQTESALDYYNTALNLSAGKQVVFNEAKVLARIETISANLN